MANLIMDKLEYVGVMAMECFVVGEKLLIPEAIRLLRQKLF
jgi:5-(carboxyamino)imidazole ribonucleotide synthase